MHNCPEVVKRERAAAARYEVWSPASHNRNTGIGDDQWLSKDAQTRKVSQPDVSWIARRKKFTQGEVGRRIARMRPAKETLCAEKLPRVRNGPLCGEIAEEFLLRNSALSQPSFRTDFIT